MEAFEAGWSQNTDKDMPSLILGVGRAKKWSGISQSSELACRRHRKWHLPRKLGAGRAGRGWQFSLPGWHVPG
eukprot:3147979-Prymnesium_polylepis.1